MDKNIFLETLEYYLNDLDKNKGESIKKYLYDKNKHIFNVPIILYLTSQYIYEDTLVHNNLQFKLYYSPEDKKIYPFVTNNEKNLDITQKSDLWLQVRNEPKPQEEYSERVECQDVLIAHMLLECYYSYITEEKNYVPDEFYNCVLSMLFLYVPTAYEVFLKNIDDDKRAICENALKNVKEFAISFKKIVKFDEFKQKILDEDTSIGGHFKNAIDLYAKSVSVESSSFKLGLSILKNQITIFNNFCRL